LREKGVRSIAEILRYFLLRLQWRSNVALQTLALGGVNQYLLPGKVSRPRFGIGFGMLILHWSFEYTGRFSWDECDLPGIGPMSATSVNLEPSYSITTRCVDMFLRHTFMLRAPIATQFLVIKAVLSISSSPMPCVVYEP
jgi:hypothetical protein